MSGDKEVSEVPVLGLVAKCSVNMICPGTRGLNCGQEVRVAEICQMEKGQRLGSLDVETYWS